MVVYSFFFNGNYTLEVALALSASEIIALFQRFAANEDRYGVQEEARGYMESAVSMIKTIHERYKKDPRLNPGYTVDGLIVGYQGNEFKLQTLYDIVGWIFSVVGNVPNGATRENYYYALMMIAYIFCTKLIPATTIEGKQKEIRSMAPDVWSVMWFNQKVNNRPVTRVLLGATLDDPPGNIKNKAKEFRKDLLRKEGILVWRDGTPLPTQKWGPRGIVGRDFGNCAETYPLLFICSLAKDRSEAFEIRGSAEGLAALAPALYDASVPEITPYRDAKGKVNPKIMRPCTNCACLMGELGNGFTVAKFEDRKSVV